MMRKKFCDELHLVSEDEILDMTAIAQSAPGALAVNSAIIFGYRLAGFTGALVSVLGTVIPPIVIISIIRMIYDAFSTNHIVQIALQVMRAGVAAIIVDAVIDLGGKVIASKDLINISLMLIAFVASWFFKVSAITIILIFIALGLAIPFMNRTKEENV
jgi:chromate transporter